MVLTYVLLKKTAMGMYVQAVGINERASRLVGLKSTKIIWMAYAFCGLCAGIAGLVASSRIYSADANNIGLNMELDAITAVIMGGTPIRGGNASIAGTVLAVLILGIIRNGLTLLSVSSDFQQWITGFLLLASVLISEIRVWNIKALTK